MLMVPNAIRFIRLIRLVAIFLVLAIIADYVVALFSYPRSGELWEYLATQKAQLTVFVLIASLTVWLAVIALTVWVQMLLMPERIKFSTKLMFPVFQLIKSLLLVAWLALMGLIYPFFVFSFALARLSSDGVTEPLSPVIFSPLVLLLGGPTLFVLWAFLALGIRVVSRFGRTR